MLVSASKVTAQLFTEVDHTTLNTYPDLEVVHFNVNVDELNKSLAQKSTAVKLDFPFYNNNQLQLELVEFKIHSQNFRLTERNTAGDTERKDYKFGTYYRGQVKSDPNSNVLLANHNGELSGVIWFKNEVYNFGKKLSAETHILYKADSVNEEDLGLKCGTAPSKAKPTKQLYQKSSTGCASVVNVYFECDYDMYQNFNSNSASVTNYVNTMFAEVSTLYSNESIDIQISEIVVWTGSDNYASGVGALTQFATAHSAGFNGDIAHLLTNDSGANGGIAYVDQLCGNLPFAYSDIQNSSAVYPTYSWDVQVVAHEMGHNFGSAHTHDCVWGPNNDQQIDDCGNIATGGGGSCYDASNTTIPSSGGTIMSYCHLNSVGINFAEGFGPEPGALIRANHSSCFCDNSSCDDAIQLTNSGTFFAEPNNGNGASSSSAAHADWFEFTAQAAGTIDLYSCSEGVDTRVFLHSGSCSNLNYEAMSDDDCTSSGSSNYASEILGHSVIAGMTYFIEWDNRWSTAGFNWEFVFTPNSGGGVTITCPQDHMATNTCNASDYDVSVTGTATSSTSGASISYSDQITTTNCTVVVDRTWVATDGNGSASCVQLIDLDDDQGPNLTTACPNHITVTSNNNCEAVVSWSAPAAGDECSSVTSSSSYNPGAVFTVGTHPVVYNFSDGCGNSTSCVFNVVVLNGCSSNTSQCNGVNISLNSSAIATETYHAQQSLDATGMVPASNSPIFKAGQSIELKPGFEIQAGGQLEVMIENCNN